MIIFERPYKYKKIQKTRTEITACYYVACLMDKLLNHKGTVLIRKPQQIIDIIVSPNLYKNDDFGTIVQNGIMYIEVKGTYEKEPISERIYESIDRIHDKYPGVYPKFYFFFEVFNIYKNKKPSLIVLDGKYIEGIKGTLKCDSTYHVLSINKKVKSGEIKAYNDIFSVLSNTLVRDIFDSFKEGYVINSDVLDRNQSDMPFFYLGCKINKSKENYLFKTKHSEKTLSTLLPTKNIDRNVGSVSTRALSDIGKDIKTEEKRINRNIVFNNIQNSLERNPILTSKKMKSLIRYSKGKINIAWLYYPPSPTAKVFQVMLKDGNYPNKLIKYLSNWGRGGYDYKFRLIYIRDLNDAKIVIQLVNHALSNF